MGDNEIVFSGDNMTNIGQTKAEIILSLVNSMNRGNSGYPCDRVYKALGQYDDLIRAGILVEVAS